MVRKRLEQAIPRKDGPKFAPTQGLVGGANAELRDSE
jgi:hypothetical protein